MEKRIIELEKKVTYQDDLIEELNSAVTEQQKSIDLLQRQLNQMIDQIQTGGGGDHKRDILDEKPPHY